MATLVIVAASLAGCGSDDPEPQATTQPAQAAAGADVNGTYERRLTRADIERTATRRDESSPGQDAPSPGRLRLALADGTLTMTDLGAGLEIRQDFSATSDGALRIGAYQAPEEGAFCGPEISQTASYSWNRSGDVLTLTAEQDECADRDSSLSGSWTLR